MGLDANRSSLGIPDRELFLDPVVLPAEAGTGGAVGVHLVGNLCHPADITVATPGPGC